MSTPTRVLVDGSALADGRRDAGIGRYVRQLFDALQEVEDLDAHLVRPWPPPHESQLVRFLSPQPALLAAAVRFHPDVVHAPAGDPVLGSPKARQVVTVHDTVPWEGHRGGIAGAYLGGQRHRIQRCARVIAVSPDVAEGVVRVLGVDPDRVRVVPEGFNPVFTAVPDPGDAEAAAAAGVPAGPYVLWVGSLRAHDPRKALDVLVDAMGGLAATLVLVGAPGAESTRVANLAAARGVRVAMPGFVDDAVLASLYRHAGVVAVPSLHEGFGLPVLEALACGAPVVASAVGNIPHLAGDAADLVAPGDAAALRGAIDRMLTDEEHRQLLAGRGPAIAAGYSWQRAAVLTVAVYCEVSEETVNN